MRRWRYGLTGPSKWCGTACGAASLSSCMPGPPTAAPASPRRRSWCGCGRTPAARGIVTSLAVSPCGRLALCWQQARSPDPYDQRVACKVTAKHGGWGPTQPILPANRDRQYLPAVAFQGEGLWVVAYVSSATSTRLVAVRSQGHHFGRPLTVNRWPIPSQRISAPAPPAPVEGHTFIGDYIGLVTTRRQVVVAYIQPSADPSELNRVLVSSF
jgi:hypothetical protein